MVDGNGYTLNLQSAAKYKAHSPLQGVAKRLLDVLIAASALFFLSPIMLLLALAIRLQDGGPAIFSHKRIGKDGRSFECFKFRSMVIDAQARLEALLASDAQAAAEWARDQKLRNDPRITPLGRFIRKSSFDELPQLFNILRGEMSIVGPRPIIAEEIVRYGASFADYASVPPGITGLWQVSGRNNVSYDERVALDAHYASSWSVVGDVGIILRTVPVVLFRRGAS